MGGENLLNHALSFFGELWHDAVGLMIKSKNDWWIGQPQVAVQH